MSREEVQNLLAGYATGTLSESERRALFEAALDDQELFDRLAKEEALREVLDDPAARQQLIAALGPARQTFGDRVWGWLRQPAVLAAAGAVAVLLIGAGIMLRQSMNPKREAIVAQVLPPSAPAGAPLAAPPMEAKKAAPVERKSKRLTGGGAGGNARPSPPAPQTPPPAALPATRGLDFANGAPQGSAAAPQPSPPPPPEQVTVAAAQQPIREAKALKRAAASPDLPYVLLLKKPGGVYAPAHTGATLHTGDAVRVRVTPDQDGYLYLFRRTGPSASGKVLAASQRVEKGQSYELPSEGGLQAQGTAQLQLMLVLTPDEQTALAANSDASLDSLASIPGAHAVSIEVPSLPGCEGCLSRPSALGSSLHATPAKPPATAAPPKQP
ncbi:MAG: hypothetical protein ACLP59_07565 [Bryobacteraceae bacterium]